MGGKEGGGRAQCRPGTSASVGSPSAASQSQHTRLTCQGYGLRLFLCVQMRFFGILAVLARCDWIWSLGALQPEPGGEAPMSENSECPANGTSAKQNSPPPPPQLTRDDQWKQLGNAVALAAKQDQIAWAIFGVFWAANAVLLVALFTTGALPQPSVGLVVSSVGVVLSLVWRAIERRAVEWLKHYERVLGDWKLNSPCRLQLPCWVRGESEGRRFGHSWSAVLMYPQCSGARRRWGS